MITLPPQLKSLFSHRSPGGISMNPGRDWGVILGIAALGLAGIVMWNLWVFDVVVSGRALREVAPASTAAVNKSSLEAIQNLFTDRAAEEAKYTDGTYLFADPSE